MELQIRNELALGLSSKVVHTSNIQSQRYGIEQKQNAEGINMRTCIAVLAAGSAMLLAPAYAQPQSETGLLSSGDVRAGFGLRGCRNTDTDAGAGDCGRHPAAEIGGRWSFPLGNSFSLQLDAEYERNWNMHDQSHQVAKVPSLGLHASYRDPSRFLLGAFGGHTGTEVDANSGSHRTKGPFYGVEGQFYVNRVTVYGQVGKAKINNYNSGDNEFKGRFETIAGRFFPTDDSMIQIAYGHGHTNNFEDKGDWGTAKEYSVLGTMRVTQSMPLYGFVKYKHGKYIANTEDVGKDKALMIGVSWLFGAPSLLAQDRRGATLSTPMLPGRAAGWSQALD